MLTMRFPRGSIARRVRRNGASREPNDDRIDSLLRSQRIGEAISDDGVRGGRVEDRVAGERDAVDAALAETRLEIGVAIVIRVAQHQHAADLSSLVQHADDHVAVLAHRRDGAPVRRSRRTPSRKNPPGSLSVGSQPPVAEVAVDFRDPHAGDRSRRRTRRCIGEEGRTGGTDIGDAINVHEAVLWRMDVPDPRTTVPATR